MQYSNLSRGNENAERFWYKGERDQEREARGSDGNEKNCSLNRIC